MQQPGGAQTREVTTQREVAVTLQVSLQSFASHRRECGIQISHGALLRVTELLWAMHGVTQQQRAFTAVVDREHGVAGRVARRWHCRDGRSQVGIRKHPIGSRATPGVSWRFADFPCYGTDSRPEASA
ncbi:MAG: hypothetical protein QOE61_3921 [Micromonosporaceae bacterium]|jgi:hypothetical protein|nr:hypothetical protein [Micromonosporaceae bacterium]